MKQSVLDGFGRQTSVTKLVRGDWFPCSLDQAETWQHHGIQESILKIPGNCSSNLQINLKEIQKRAITFLEIVLF